MGSILASLSAGPSLVMQGQTALVIIMEFAKLNKTGKDVDWHYLLSSLCWIIISGGIIQHLSE